MDTDGWLRLALNGRNKMDKFILVISALGFGALMIGCLVYALFGDDYKTHEMKDRWKP